MSSSSHAASTHAHSRCTFAALASQENCGARTSTVRHSVGRCCLGADAFTYAGASADASCSHLRIHTYRELVTEVKQVLQAHLQTNFNSA